MNPIGTRALFLSWTIVLVFATVEGFQSTPRFLYSHDIRRIQSHRLQSNSWITSHRLNNPNIIFQTQTNTKLYKTKNFHTNDETHTDTDMEAVSSYNDDAFGLVFLTSLFITQDYLFCILFTAFSFAAVLGTKNQWKLFSSIRNPIIIPGLVALISFVINVAFNVAIPSLGESQSLAWNDLDVSSSSLLPFTTNQIYELAVCFISAVYAFVTSKSKE